ncbi:MAG: hypothetical protein E7255_05450 [Lachnospiraceae bacterium]|jgi:hypothetical protein|nr:hypothetical protein [Lachnospiraceae bacterium]
MEQPKGKVLGEYPLLPDVLRKHQVTTLLDDKTLDDIEKSLQTRIRIVQSDGKSFIEVITDRPLIEIEDE